MGDVPGDKNNNTGIWNGGTTRINKEEARIFRRMEDYYDVVDSEVQTREELEERQVIMNETKIEKKPYQELYKGINKGMTRKTKISGMGGVQMKNSDRFNRKKK